LAPQSETLSELMQYMQRTLPDTLRTNLGEPVTPLIPGVVESVCQIFKSFLDKSLPTVIDAGFAQPVDEPATGPEYAATPGVDMCPGEQLSPDNTSKNEEAALSNPGGDYQSKESSLESTHETENDSTPFPWRQPHEWQRVYYLVGSDYASSHTDPKTFDSPLSFWHQDILEQIPMFDGKLTTYPSSPPYWLSHDELYAELPTSEHRPISELPELPDPQAFLASPIQQP